MATLQERIEALAILTGFDISTLALELQGLSTDIAKEVTLAQVRDRLILNDSQTAMMVGNARAKFRDGFRDLDDWNMVGAQGTGQTVTVAGSANGSRYVTFSSGVTANAETIYQSKETFSPPFKFSFAASASQNIANTEFHVELVEVDDTGALIPDIAISTGPLFKDARNGMGFVFNGTTTSSGLYKIRADGISELSAAAAITKTQTGTSPNFAPTQEVTILTQLDLCEGWTRAINQTTIPTPLFHRKDYVPRPWAKYAIRLRVKNGAVAPASSTDFRVYWINILDAARLSVDFGVTGGSQSADIAANFRMIAAPALTASVSGTVSANPSAPTTPYSLNSAASTNGALIATGSSGLHAFAASNTGATVAYVKLYNKATAPVAGTDVPAFPPIPIPAAVGGVPGFVAIPIGYAGFRFALGLGIAITGGAADTDTTPVAAGQVKVALTRTT